MAHRKDFDTLHIKGEFAEDMRLRLENMRWRLHMMSIYKVKGKGKEGKSEGETSFIE